MAFERARYSKVLVLALVAWVAFLGYHYFYAPGPMSFSPKAVASVRISLSITQPDVPYGGNLTAYVVVSNSAWHAYDLNVPSQVTSNIRTSALSGCGWNHPFGIALYSGFINPNNITNATMPLQLWQPGLYSCPSETALSTYYLPARSTNYTKISIDGFWNGSKAGNSSENWTFESLPVGNYTLIAQDYWRQDALAHFSVVQR